MSNEYVLLLYSSVKVFNYLSLCPNIGNNHDTKKMLIKHIWYSHVNNPAQINLIFIRLAFHYSLSQIVLFVIFCIFSREIWLKEQFKDELDWLDGFSKHFYRYGKISLLSWFHLAMIIYSHSPSYSEVLKYIVTAWIKIGWNYKKVSSYLLHSQHLLVPNHLGPHLVLDLRNLLLSGLNTHKCDWDHCCY